MLLVDENVVLRTFTEEVDGYFEVQVGAGARKRKNVKGTVMGHYLKYLPELRVGEDDHRHLSHYPSPPYLVREFRVTDAEYLPAPGTAMHGTLCPGITSIYPVFSRGKGSRGR